MKVINLADGLPPEEGTTTLRCKFVLLTLDNEVALVFGRLKEYPYHANLLERFCTMHRIPSGWEHRPDIYALHTYDARVRGGGYLFIDEPGRTLRFFGRSTAYGSYDEERLRDVITQSPLFSGWSIEYDRD